MSSSERYERRLPTLLEELSAPRTPDYFDDILGQVGRTRQRPGWTFPERWLPMSAVSERLAAAPRAPIRAVAVAALLLLAIAAGIALLAGSNHQRLPAPFGPAANGLIPYTAGGDVYVGDLQTGATRLIVGGPETDAYPKFSPDGSQLAFTRDVAPGVGPIRVDVFVVAADGSHLRRITPEPVLWQWISWTPDGRRVAVVHDVDGTMQLDMLDASGGGSAQRISAAAGLDSLEFRPPDGREILFRATVDDISSGVTIKPKVPGLFVMNADGTNVRTLINPPHDQPADTLDMTGATYSADGSQIFYNHWTSDASFGDPGCCQLFAMNADGSNQHKFIPNAGDTWDGQAAASPDGKWIAFWHNLPNRSTHRVSVVRADGTGTVVETGPPLAGTAHWIWAPDSSRILMYPDNNSNLSGFAYLLDPNGGPSTQLPWRSDADLDWQRTALQE